jgi:stage III sporulation protein AG
MERFLKKIKDFFCKTGSWKKNIENLVIFLIGIVIVISVSGYLFGGNEGEEVINNVSDDIFDPVEFERKLSNILSNINGAGEVEVMVSYQTGTETIPLIDTKDNKTLTEETGNDGTRKTEQNQIETNIIFNQEKSGNKIPYISKKIMPKVEGAIVTCDGGGDITVKADIIKAVQAVTGISANKIQVFPKMNKEK